MTMLYKTLEALKMSTLAVSLQTRGDSDKISLSFVRS